MKIEEMAAIAARAYEHGFLDAYKRVRAKPGQQLELFEQEAPARPQALPLPQKTPMEQFFEARVEVDITMQAQVFIADLYSAYVNWTSTSSHGRPEFIGNFAKALRRWLRGRLCAEVELVSVAELQKINPVSTRAAFVNAFMAGLLKRASPKVAGRPEFYRGLRLK